MSRWRASQRSASFKELLTVGREPHSLASPPAVDEREPEALLECLEPVANRGLGHVEVLSRLGEGLVADDGEKRGELEIEHPLLEVGHFHGRHLNTFYHRTEGAR